MSLSVPYYNLLLEAFRQSESFDKIAAAAQIIGDNFNFEDYYIYKKDDFAYLP